MPTAYCYTSTTSVFPGDMFNVHASASPASYFELRIFCLGKLDTCFHTDTVYVEDILVPAEVYANGCNWPPVKSFSIPQNWPSGVYTLRLSSAGVVMANTFFVVKSSQPSNSNILYILEVTTASAYNGWGGKSLYDDIPKSPPGNSANRRSFKVSLDRPWTSEPPFLGQGGTLDSVGEVWLKGSDGEAWLNGFYHPTFINWLEAERLSVDFCTNIDLHYSPDVLSPYQLVLSVGHDEYWSKEMRDNLELFVANGGNVAFFSGNVCWWQIRLEDDGRTIICYKDLTDPSAAAQKTINWYDYPVLRPENRMTGVSYRDGAQSSGLLPADYADYVVKAADHWVFTGAFDGGTDTGLVKGATFGHAAQIVGYETDAADLSHGTPSNFVTLAEANLTGEGWVIPGRITMGIFSPVATPQIVSGTVFTAATTGWGAGLAPEWQNDDDLRPVSIITRNVLKRLSKPTRSSLSHRYPIFQYHSAKPYWRFLYSQNPGEGEGWDSDGVAFFAVPSDANEALPIYQYHAIDNRGVWRFLYSTVWIAPPDTQGWTFDKVAFYAYPLATTAPGGVIPIYELHAPEPSYRNRYSPYGGSIDGWTCDEAVAFYAFDSF